MSRITPRLRRAAPVLLLALLAACGRGPALPDVDLLLRVEADARQVEFGAGFDLRVERVWHGDLDPAPWDDAMLAPLIVRAERVERHESGSHVRETRTYRAHAFTHENVRIPSIEMSARPRRGGSVLTTSSEPVHVAVRPGLDPAAPGAPEMPGPPLADAPGWRMWAVGLALALGVLWGGLLLRRRRPALDVGEATSPAAYALARLAALRSRPASASDPLARHVGEAADVVRTYLAERFEVPAGSRTREEILARRDDASLAALLASAELAKYAAHAPGATERARALDDAERFVRDAEGEAP